MKYGIFDGISMNRISILNTCNREERRRYVKEVKQDKSNIIKCKYCGYLARTLTDDNSDICCEMCGIKVGI